MFHGNGGNHGHRIPLGKIFFGKMRCNVIMMSYRGQVLYAVFDLPPLLTQCSRLAAMVTPRARLRKRVRGPPPRVDLALNKR